MRLSIFQADAFTDRVFGGNPAAVCPLDRWIDDDLMQSIAEENNLAETAFIAKTNDDYEIRWFTPNVEVQLCGHATLASAHIVFEVLEPGRKSVTFHSKSGPLPVDKNGELLTLDFPRREYKAIELPPAFAQALRSHPAESYFSVENYMLVYPKASDVAEFDPALKGLDQTGCLGVIVTAPGERSDFVSRFFAPSVGISEDPVTGSAHCSLAPFWSERLAKKQLHALQISKRGGELFCEVLEERVHISGRAVRYLQGTIEVGAV